MSSLCSTISPTLTPTLTPTLSPTEEDDSDDRRIKPKKKDNKIKMQKKMETMLVRDPMKFRKNALAKKSTSMNIASIIGKSDVDGTKADNEAGDR